MDCETSDAAHTSSRAAGSGLRRPRAVPGTVRYAAKIVVAGGFGVGKTTLVHAVSDIEPLSTDERMTASSVGVDSLAGVPQKTETTVTMDFGRIQIDDEVVLYLFGTPGQVRFWDAWPELAYGAVGGVVLADTRRLDGSFDVLDLMDTVGMPYVVAINIFDDTPDFPLPTVRRHLDLPDHVPLCTCDARNRDSCRKVLIAVADHAVRRRRAALPAEPPNV